MSLILAITTVFATLFSPIIAIRVQKYLEGKSQKQTVKVKIFSQLMATRAVSSRLLPEHVQALNMIDLAFHGDVKRGKTNRSDTEKKVLVAWKEYFSHLCSVVPISESGAELWNQKSNQLFLNLLYEMATDIGYDFDKVHLENAIYSPNAHGDMNVDQFKIRKGLASLLSGENPVKVQLIANQEKKSIKDYYY